MKLFSASFLIGTFMLWIILKREFTTYSKFATDKNANGTLIDQSFGQTSTAAATNTTSWLDGLFGIPTGATNMFQTLFFGAP